MCCGVCCAYDRTLFSQCATTSSSHFWWSVTGSHDSVASLTPLALSSLYLSARRPISVVHTGCGAGEQRVRTASAHCCQIAFGAKQCTPAKRDTCTGIKLTVAVEGCPLA